VKYVEGGAESGGPGTRAVHSSSDGAPPEASLGDDGLHHRRAPGQDDAEAEPRDRGAPLRGAQPADELLPKGRTM
jgi:hypothetical protein